MVLAFSFLSIYWLCHLWQGEFVKLKLLEVELYHAVGKTSDIIGHTLIIGCTMAPLCQVAFHLVGHYACEFIALITRLHGLEGLCKLGDEATIVAQRHAVILVAKLQRLGFGEQTFGFFYVAWPVDIQCFATHEIEMIPKGLSETGIIRGLCHLSGHNIHNAVSTPLPLVLSRKTHGLVYHLLHLSAIFWQKELFTLGVVIQSWDIHIVSLSVFL